MAARVPTLPPATHTNSYALGQREVLLVEPATPYVDEQRAWLAWARGLSSRGRRPIALMLTHHHPDHIAGAALFARELALPLWAHPLTAARLGDTAVERLLHDGEVLTLAGPNPQRWHCLHTPGHAPGHMCWHEPSLNIAVVGDMVASVGTIVIDPSDGDMAAYLQQLRRLLALRLTIALPAHGAPIADPNAKFQQYISHRLARETKIMAALRQLHPRAAVAGERGSSLDALLPLAYQTTPAWLWPLAKRSLEAHLLKLLAEGRVRRHDSGGWWLPPAPATRPQR